MSYSQPTGEVAHVAPAPVMPGERFTRVFVTIDAALVILLAFGFGFGNGWATARLLGVSPWIAPLAQPAVDLAVVGLMIGIRYLAIHGWTDDQLRKPRWWLRLFGLMTLAMNTALPLHEHKLGRAAWDAIGPILLIAWSELAPWLLRAIYSVRGAQQILPAPPPSAPDSLPVPKPVETFKPEPVVKPCAPPVPPPSAPPVGRPAVTWTGDVADLARDFCLARSERGEGYDGVIGEVWEAVLPIWKAKGEKGLTRRWVGARCAEQWDALYEKGLVHTPRSDKKRLHPVS